MTCPANLVLVRRGRRDGLAPCQVPEGKHRSRQCVDEHGPIVRAIHVAAWNETSTDRREVEFYERDAYDLDAHALIAGGAP